MANVAFLVFNKKLANSRRKDKSFDGGSNIGAYIIKDILERNKIDVSFCSPEFADKYKIVLVSLTSTYDVLNFLENIISIKTWKKRNFKVIAGGAGLQNIYPLREYIDYGVFGRGENIIVRLIQSILTKKDFLHESVMNLSRGIYPVKIAQAKRLYPFEIDVKPVKYQERMLGCKNKCLFCHYTFAREYCKQGNTDYQSPVGFSKTTDEILFRELLLKSKFKGRIRTAIDGQSERLRFAFNKRISNEQIKKTLEELSVRWQGESVWVFIYTIGNYPTESEKDRREIEELMRTIQIKGKNVCIYFHISIFRPSPLTPSVYLPVNLEYDWSKRDYKIINTDNLHVNYDFSREGLFSFFSTLIIERATEKTDQIIETMLFNKKLNKMDSVQKYNALRNTFDLTDYTREYSTEEQLPTWYLESYIDNEKIKTMANKLKKKLGLIKNV